MINAPGIYDLTEAQYHADPCPVPSLSHSILKMLLQRTPRHAWAHHPRLGDRLTVEPDEKMDHGSIVHKLLLGRGADVVPLTARYDGKHERVGQLCTDFKTKAAQQERAAIRSAGKLPVLACELVRLEACAAAVTEQMRAHRDLRAFFEPGRSEAVMVWERGGIWRRAMVDRLADNPRSPMFDVKLTGMSAAPGAWEKRLIHEYATQAVFYRAGAREIRGVEPGPFLFIVVEDEEPFGMSVMSPAASLLDYAAREIERAEEVWRDCLARNDWPLYPAFTSYVELPAYMELREEEAAIRRQFIREAHDHNSPFNHEFGEPSKVRA